MQFIKSNASDLTVVKELMSHIVNKSIHTKGNVWLLYHACPLCILAVRIYDSYGAVDCSEKYDRISICQKRLRCTVCSVILLN
jgi:hypothetical protein